MGDVQLYFVTLCKCLDFIYHVCFSHLSLSGKSLLFCSKDTRDLELPCCVGDKLTLPSTGVDYSGTLSGLLPDIF